MDEMLTKQAQEFKGLGKQLGFKDGGGDSDEEADPELKALNAQLKKKGIPISYVTLCYIEKMAA
jgi:hypothetical protein